MNRHHQHPEDKLHYPNEEDLAYQKLQKLAEAIAMYLNGITQGQGASLVQLLSTVDNPLQVFLSGGFGDTTQSGVLSPVGPFDVNLTPGQDFVINNSNIPLQAYIAFIAFYPTAHPTYPTVTPPEITAKGGTTLTIRGDAMNTGLGKVIVYVYTQN